MSINWDRFRELIHSHENFLLTSHIRPDCDALGSELGMAGVLDALGKKVRIVNAQATPEHLCFIDPTNRVKTIGEDITPAELTDVDLIMVLDTSAWIQLGDMAQVIRDSSATKVIVDHHVSEDDLGAELFKNTTAEAAGRLVIEAADALEVPLTPEIAKPLFAAMTTDTGWFRFSSVTGDTYRYAARLIDAGASPPALYTALYERDTVSRVRLRATALVRVELELDGRLVYTHVSREDYEATGAAPTDTEDVINLTLGIAGTEAAVIFIEQPTGDFKVSFRSRGQVDCSEVAQQFGGGGHKAAAGASLSGSLEEIKAQVLPAMRSAMAS